MKLSRKEEVLYRVELMRQVSVVVFNWIIDHDIKCSGVALTALLKDLESLLFPKDIYEVSE